MDGVVLWMMRGDFVYNTECGYRCRVGGDRMYGCGWGMVGLGKRLVSMKREVGKGEWKG